MYYYLIPIAILFTLVTFSYKFSVSPFASQQVKKICANMTKAERTQHNLRGGFGGLVLGIVPAAISFTVVKLFFDSALQGLLIGISVMGVIILTILVITLICKKPLPYITKWQQSFFASTEWAKSEGIEADDIQLFRWKQK